MKAFVSSEMDGPLHRARRLAVVHELQEMGHSPVYFEAEPARPIRSGGTMDTFLRGKVGECDVLLEIVDGKLTPGMRLEVNEANEHLGSDRVIYYFARGSRRDEAAEALWRSVKDQNIVGLFDSQEELLKEVRRTVASYVDDVVRSSRTGMKVVYEQPVTCDPGMFHWVRLPLEKGDRVKVTCLGDGVFYACFYPSDRFAALYQDHENEGMPFGSDSSAFHDDVQVKEDDDWYLALKRGVWNGTSVKVSVRITRSHP